MHAYVAPKDVLGTFWTYPGSPGQIRERLSPTPWQIFSNAWAGSFLGCGFGMLEALQRFFHDSQTAPRAGHGVRCWKARA